MSLLISGSIFRAFLQDEKAWSDNGGFDGVSIMIDGAAPTSDWDPEDIHPGQSITVLAGTRLDRDGNPMGCFITHLRAWQSTLSLCRVVMDIPGVSRDSLDRYACSLGGAAVAVEA